MIYFPFDYFPSTDALKDFFSVMKATRRALDFESASWNIMKNMEKNQRSGGLFKKKDFGL